MNDDELSNKIEAAATGLLQEGEILIHAVLVIDVLSSNGDDRVIRTMASEMPWWIANGMLEGAKIVLADAYIEAEDDDT